MAKEVGHTAGPVKKASAEQVARMHERALSGHDMIGGLDVSSFGSLTTGLLANMDAAAVGGGDLDVSAALGGEGLTSVSLRQHIMQQGMAASSTQLALPAQDQVAPLIWVKL